MTAADKKLNGDESCVHRQHAALGSHLIGLCLPRFVLVFSDEAVSMFTLCIRR